ncbi:MAG: DUF1365 domain-containing protein [Acidobacteria bacterium]|nr:DUF1365 domain-containing protein [Acidobacteriota bacterium]
MCLNWWLGEVSHFRRLPKPHRFRYPLLYAWVDLGEWLGTGQHTLKGGWGLSLRWSDYFELPFEPSALAQLRAAFQDRLGNPVSRLKLVALPRMMGFCFNPVTFLVAVNAEDRPIGLKAEITNTPWDEKCSYFLALDPKLSTQSHLFQKDFHVSPFHSMNQTYHWLIQLAGTEKTEIQMVNYESGKAIFGATLNLKPIPETTAQQFARRHPLHSYGVLVSIYWQALRLWLKRTPFHAHPEKRKDPQWKKTPSNPIPR